MGSISLKLRGNKIYINVNYGAKKQKRYATGYGVEAPKNWDSKRFRVKNVSSEPRSVFINAQLQQLVVTAQDLIDECNRNKIELTNDLIKKTLDIATSKTKPVANDHKNLLDFYEWFIDYYKENPHPKTNTPLANGTIRGYKTALKKLKEFNPKINYDDVDLNFHKEYSSYLQSNNYSNNYIGNQIKQLKAIMNAALERNLHHNLEFKKTTFAKVTEKVDDIYLTTGEIAIIENLELEHNGVRRARDLFLIQYYTGMRVGDLRQLTKMNIKLTRDKIKYLEYKQRKTGKTVQIPIGHKFEQLLNRNNGSFPKIMSDQKINDYLKIIGQKAELKGSIIKEKTIGGKKQKLTHKRKDIITNHTARRSFCTNAYKAGMSTIDIMAMSGHSSETVFYRYIKITPNERLDRLSKHIFFK
ncbi:tyrosine-type recombinase/integrase [Dokdonia donghaensis]|uniref:Tyr recombinase domain-containing protein n=1 Tax=Dokdonia donghaensis DSW-1 TaxID=1300343 RepID=A0A0A2GZR1_9FLAO|nr:site-specific integrase [Dokdonia donghaensis]ANH60868.1 site-specific tyrosine recombinase XerD [Dokdonia donghaensis DSW-1]KGO05880.1 hypothetical protein NV36_02805 [Dokdonia donghaensis DSW-1]